MTALSIAIAASSGIAFAIGCGSDASSNSEDSPDACCGPIGERVEGGAAAADASGSSDGGGADASGSTDGGGVDAALTGYCAELAALDVQCLGGHVCTPTTAEWCPLTVAHENADMVEGQARCYAGDAGCDLWPLVCAYRYAAGRPRTQEQAQFAAALCGVCGDEFGPGCSTGFYDLDTHKLRNARGIGLQWDDATLAGIAQSCATAERVDAGPSGDSQRCDRAFADCAKAWLEDAGIPQTVTCH